MTLEPAQLVAAWPLGLSLAVAVAAGSVRAGRRRMALNEALHELRRPLQAIALAGPAAARAIEPAAFESSVDLAATALERLQREINGEAPPRVREAVPARPILAAALSRWAAKAALAGSSLELRWGAGEATVAAEPRELAQALDNLIVNAIEHGGPEIVVAAAPPLGGCGSP